MPNPKKFEQLKEIRGALKGSSAVYFLDYQGLNVADISALRRKLKEARAEFKVAKNTLLKIALDEVGLDASPILRGPTGVLLTMEDPVAPLKVLMEFAKEKEAIKPKGGFLEGKFFDGSQMKELSRLPSKNELLAQILGSLQAPIQGLLWALEGPISNLVFTLQAIAQK
ncbi:MAG: 50S ribosomal protein L10 [Caldiserica bacterium]|nr:50S ribosomal protein L10 [Caldisericota bacterium]MDH7563001.1 50S ribosomal protein L10 [Caldisericota bacterium]